MSLIVEKENVSFECLVNVAARSEEPKTEGTEDWESERLGERRTAGEDSRNWQNSSIRFSLSISAASAGIRAGGALLSSKKNVPAVKVVFRVVAMSQERHASALPGGR